ncbi:hypothetical protein M902_0867 [Bacteriovorax sp. BAL6_X]|uniref:hypothetical protein n=1 Tax=Bacteriovorax sp. BAL6_X TaxID=1201290 RepID=UPI00038559C1|nr:hypothetical protein [Bacteriovorax sp. BAL6_X]EPZ50024.1 hypothetical protein M902_0867 [Bacteriovorax sp. BAL6_X]
MRTRLILLFISTIIEINTYTQGTTAIESHKDYEIAVCQNIVTNNQSDEYYIGCENGRIRYFENLTTLSKSASAIERNIYEDSLLNELRDFTISELRKNKAYFDKIKECLISNNPSCNDIRESILKTVRMESPKLRAMMSMMIPPPKFQRMKPILYNTTIKHKFLNKELKALTKEERVRIEEEAKAIKYHFTQAWFEQNFEKNKCIEKLSPTSFRFRPSKSRYSCESFHQRTLDEAVSYDMSKYRKELKKQYNNKLAKNPILAQIDLRGTESDKEILSEVTTVISDLAKQTSLSIDRLTHLKKEDEASLIRNDNILNSFIKDRGVSKVLCDVSQNLKDQEEFKEIRTDLALAGAALIGGGVCAFTAGIGCMIGVGVAAETIGISLAQNRYKEAALAFNSGLTTAQIYEDRKFERDFTLLLAPLSITGEIIGSSVKYTSKAMRYSPTGTSIDYDLKGIRKRDLYRQSTFINRSDKIGSRANFISKYEDYILTGPELNNRWIQNARATNASLYLDIENSALKRLNDTIGDKSLVTALTNSHKTIIATRINELLKKYPNIDIEVYSDFKSTRYAFVPKGIPSEIKAQLTKELNSVYQEANREFANMVKTMEGIPTQENIQGWFQAGIGGTADEAGQATKRSRSVDRSGQIASFQKVKFTIEEDVKNVVKYTARLNPNHPLAKVGLIERIDDQNTFVPTLEVFEVARKITGPSYARGEYLANELNQRFGSKLSIQEGQDLMKYIKNLDSLTPGLWIKERVHANLNSAVSGGMSGDITGMGARNIRQVAFDILNNDKNSPSDIVKVTREGEVKVTKTFNQIKARFNNIVKDVLDERQIEYTNACSGDDCVMIPSKELTAKDQIALVSKFASQENPSQFRLSIIPAGVKQNDRTNLALHGELIEKHLRKILTGVDAGKINHSKLRNLTIATKMPTQIKKGKIDLIIGVKETHEFTNDEQILIEKALKESIKKVNKELGSETVENNSHYSAGTMAWI